MEQDDDFITWSNEMIAKKNARILRMDAQGVQRRDWVCEACGSKFKWWSEKGVVDHTATKKHNTKRLRTDNLGVK